MSRNTTADALIVFKALAVTSKGEYVMKLHNNFYSNPKRLEALVKSGVIQRKRNLSVSSKVKPINIEKFCMPCDACDIAKNTRALYKEKIMTIMTVGFVWQMDISGKRPTTIL